MNSYNHNQSTLKVCQAVESELKALDIDFIQYEEGLPLYFVNDMNDFDKALTYWMDLSEKIRETRDLDHTLSYIDIAKKCKLPLLFKAKKMILIKGVAKESITFKTAASLFKKCGDFSDDETLEIKQNLNRGIHLVGHRAFVENRAHIFNSHKYSLRYGNCLNEYKRLNFCTKGLIINKEDGFVITRSEDRKKKKRRDAYANPIGSNDQWLIYIKK